MLHTVTTTLNILYLVVSAFVAFNFTFTPKIFRPCKPKHQT